MQTSKYAPNHERNGGRSGRGSVTVAQRHTATAEALARSRNAKRRSPDPSNLPRRS